jgi:hypothetical protein
MTEPPLVFTVRTLHVAPDGDVVADGDVPIDVGVDCDGIVVTIEEVAWHHRRRGGTGVVLDPLGGCVINDRGQLLPTWGRRG